MAGGTLARGGVVRHILGHDADPTTHDLNSMARLEPDGTLTYHGTGTGDGEGEAEGKGEGTGTGQRPGDAGGADGLQHELFA
jgi:hypothetical protein